MTQPPSFAPILAAESAHFRDVLAGADPGARVPTCPDWDATDLLWHLAEVQWFWGQIAARDVTPDELEHPARPQDRGELLAFFDQADADLRSALEALSADEPRWMWTQDPALHVAGYLLRRQAHEAAIHRIDAELTAGVAVTDLDPDFAADGVEEVVRVMYGREHRALTFTPDAGRIVALVADDVDQRWLLQLGREGGEVAGHGTVDDANFRPVETGEPVATITGNAQDLDRWLWNRPTARPLRRSGDESVLAALDEILTEGLQ
ncbi:maleylpyruvate isomerase family mycothiol-dependent enzyme [Calidifontibacter sp. DB0510]|uniref:Maleylpyruvate isomerase family mycothiol-dependent enzyme n=1 Tax=Metallococcus carri TaxID=1656884 RepID=A0A967AYX1_9MICO|nr:maleylpyruvate isomerase family mycothiol-dependent enzyme [Metallococcus carri]NHN54175.1 maleylpyruvate isomerase family mycothiol-dependent enzyme [Metallococcus carri]NOP36985.1 maleylpyruvate isomerase family mycothiol-dependent enzyme [Calidifontibacter sp. DB2511S]